jgi:hypothetical protein
MIDTVRLCIDMLGFSQKEKFILRKAEFVMAYTIFDVLALWISAFTKKIYFILLTLKNFPPR